MENEIVIKGHARPYRFFPFPDCGVYRSVHPSAFVVADNSEFTFGGGRTGDGIGFPDCAAGLHRSVDSRLPKPVQGNTWFLYRIRCRH